MNIQHNYNYKGKSIAVTFVALALGLETPWMPQLAVDPDEIAQPDGEFKRVFCTEWAFCPLLVRVDGGEEKQVRIHRKVQDLASMESRKDFALDVAFPETLDLIVKAA